MTSWKKMVLLCAVLGVMQPVSAQDAEVEAEREAGESQRVETEQEMVRVEAEMREAEARLEEAARRIAELSARKLPQMGGGSNWAMEFGGRPVLGITIGGSEDKGPVEGVTISGVSPGGAAAEAGLRAADIITAVNGESLAAATGKEADKKLLEFMTGVEAGDTVKFDYLRAGNKAAVEVQPRTMSARVLEFERDGHDFRFPAPPGAPGAPHPGIERFVFMSGAGGWGDVEMVKLTEGLGRYFGTKEGLLVVRAPSQESLKLEDGDVILTIDGRMPTSVGHAIRILGSYQAGENLEIQIMRDKRRQTLKIEMPDNRIGGVMEPPPPGAAFELRIAPDTRRDSSNRGG